ncbi:MAG: hypothetical protein ACRCZM_03815 [Bacteroidales bacterium]
MSEKINNFVTLNRCSGSNQPQKWLDMPVLAGWIWSLFCMVAPSSSIGCMKQNENEITIALTTRGEKNEATKKLSSSPIRVI